MSDRADMAERHGALLAQLAERGMALACALQERALAAETPAEMRDLALAFHRISRTVRQSLALEAKLARDGDRAAREARAEAERTGAAQAERRVAQVRAAVSRGIRDAYYGFDAENLEGELTERLEAEALDDRFLDEDLDAQIARLCADLGLAPEDLDPEDLDPEPDDGEGGPSAPPRPVNGHDAWPPPLTADAPAPPLNSS